MLCKFRKRRDQAGKGAADGELGDAVLLQRFRDLPDLAVPDGLAEVYPVVARRDAVAVCLEQCRVDPPFLKACCFLCDGLLKKFDLLHGVYLRFVFLFSLSVVHIFALKAHIIKLFTGINCTNIRAGNCVVYGA